MKILFATDNPYQQLNPYVSTLINGLKIIDEKITCDWGRDVFWSDKALTYDIVHIMWPEHLLRVSFLDIKTAKELNERLLFLKKEGIKIVSTCHNLQPHYNQDINFNKAYEIVYSLSNLILHLGKYSLTLFKTKFPNSKNSLLYHHIYDDRYQYIPTKEEARKKLKLSSKKKYILCFGKFRDKEERELIIQLYKNLDQNDISILAPSFYLVVKRRNIILFFINSIKYLYYKIKYPFIKMQYMPVKENDLTYYFAASDIVLLQRKKILNSGNLPLAFYLKKVVIGPEVGNVGEILKETNNPTFQVNNIASLFINMNNILSKSLIEIGEQNYQISIERFASSVICKQLYKYYLEICNR